MTTLENSIVEKFHSEILAAESSARSTVINDLYSFLGVVEKRISLTTAEAKIVVPTLWKKAETEIGTVAATLEAKL